MGPSGPGEVRPRGSLRSRAPARVAGRAPLRPGTRYPARPWGQVPLELRGIVVVATAAAIAMTVVGREAFGMGLGAAASSWAIGFATPFLSGLVVGRGALPPTLRPSQTVMFLLVGYLVWWRISAAGALVYLLVFWATVGVMYSIVPASWVRMPDDEPR